MMVKIFLQAFLPLLISSSVFAEETAVAATISGGHSQNAWQMIVGLLTVIALIFVVIWLMKSIGYGQYQSTSALKIKGCLPLSTKEKIFLIEAGDEQLLIGTAPGSVNLIKSLETPIADTQTNQISSVFAEKLKTMIKKGEAVE